MVDPSTDRNIDAGSWAVWKDRFVLLFLISAVSWSTQRLLVAYQGEGTNAAETKATAELRTQLIACRNRELDDVKARLLHMEHPAQ